MFCRIVETATGNRWWDEERVDWYIDTGNDGFGVKLRGWNPPSAHSGGGPSNVTVELKLRSGDRDAGTGGERWAKVVNARARLSSSDLESVRETVGKTLSSSGFSNVEIPRPLPVVIKTSKRRMQWSEKIQGVGSCVVERTEIDVELVRPGGIAERVGTFRSSCAEGCSTPAPSDAVAGLLFSEEETRSMKHGDVFVMAFPAFVHEIASGRHL